MFHPYSKVDFINLPLKVLHMSTLNDNVENLFLFLFYK